MKNPLPISVLALLAALLHSPLAHAEKFTLIAVAEGQIAQQVYTFLEGKCELNGDDRTAGSWKKVGDGWKCVGTRGCELYVSYAMEFQLQLRDGRGFKQRIPATGHVSATYYNVKTGEVIYNEHCTSDLYTKTFFQQKEKDLRDEFDIVNSGKIIYGFNRHCHKRVATFLVDEDTGYARNSAEHRHAFDCNNP